MTPPCFKRVQHLPVDPMKQLEMLIGSWSGKGKGSYGPFTVKAEIERRGRWLLMRHEIEVPLVRITTYVSTQVYASTT